MLNKHLLFKGPTMIMNNCFTFVYKTLKRKGFDLPTELKVISEDSEVTYDTKSLKPYVRDYEFFLKKKYHYAYFEQFCEYIKEAQENDIIIDKDGVGIAVNKYKYIAVNERSGNPCLYNIDRKKILRVKNG